MEEGKGDEDRVIDCGRKERGGKKEKDKAIKGKDPHKSDCPK